MALRRRSNVFLVVFLGLVWIGHSVSAKPVETSHCDSNYCWGSIRDDDYGESAARNITIAGVCIFVALVGTCVLCCLCCKACCCSPRPPTTIVYQLMAEPRAAVPISQIPLGPSSVPSNSTHSIVSPPPPYSYQKTTDGVHM